MFKGKVKIYVLKLKSLKLLILYDLWEILLSYLIAVVVCPKCHFQCGKVFIEFEVCRVCLDLEKNI